MKTPQLIRGIAVFKLFKGMLLLFVGIGALVLLRKDLQESFLDVIRLLRADPDNRFIHFLLAKLGLVSLTTLKKITVGTFIYAALLLTEGVGLWYQKRWGEYLTVIGTSSLIPLEIYEIWKEPRFFKGVIIFINILIVVYLIAALRKGMRRSSSSS